MWAARRVLAWAGLLGELDRRVGGSRWCCWTRSLLAVHDFQDMLMLDIPWWTFEASEQVDAFLSTRGDARVFEWGAGASTLWLARRACSVTAVEHDPDWAAHVQGAAPANVTVVLAPPCPLGGQSNPARSGRRGCRDLDFSDYVGQIDLVGGLFDLVVIDGRARSACLERTLGHLAPGGIIVLDNSNRRRYQPAIEALADEVDVRSPWGLTPCLPYPTRTAVIAKRDSSAVETR